MSWMLGTVQLDRWPGAQRVGPSLSVWVLDVLLCLASHRLVSPKEGGAILSLLQAPTWWHRGIITTLFAFSAVLYIMIWEALCRAESGNLGDRGCSRHVQFSLLPFAVPQLPLPGWSCCSGRLSLCSPPSVMSQLCVPGCFVQLCGTDFHFSDPDVGAGLLQTQGDESGCPVSLQFWAFSHSLGTFPWISSFLRVSSDVGRRSGSWWKY